MIFELNDSVPQIVLRSMAPKLLIFKTSFPSTHTIQHHWQNLEGIRHHQRRLRQELNSLLYPLLLRIHKLSHTNTLVSIFNLFHVHTQYSCTIQKNYFIKQKKRHYWLNTFEPTVFISLYFLLLSCDFYMILFFSMNVMRLISKVKLWVAPKSFYYCTEYRHSTF